MPRCLVALGSNLGDRQHMLAKAIELLQCEPCTTVLARSRTHETAPIGGSSGQGAYLNAAVSLETTLSPEQLHRVLMRIEGQLGRTRERRWDARSIDLDLLLYNSAIIHTPHLSIPHPRMGFRRFVLEPAAEVAADMVHPKIGWSVARLLEHLNTAQPYVALMGLPGSGKTALAEQLAAGFDGRFIADPAHKFGKFHHGSSPSHAYDRQIEFLVRRTGPLAPTKWPRNEPLAVSDFYFDQSLAYARIELATAEFSRFERVFTAARDWVISQKLLVILDAVAAPERATLRDELLRLAERPQIGPVLVIHDTDPSAALAELSAAVTAMR